MASFLKRAAALTALAAAVAAGGCTRGCSCGGPRGDLTVDSEGHEKRLAVPHLSGAENTRFQSRHDDANRRGRRDNLQERGR